MKTIIHHLLLLISITSIPVSAYSETFHIVYNEDDMSRRYPIFYETIDYKPGEVEVLGFAGVMDGRVDYPFAFDVEEIRIPETVTYNGENYFVTEISTSNPDFFYGNAAHYSSIGTLILPKTIVKVGELGRLFRYDQIDKVIFEDSPLEFIGPYAFSNVGDIDFGNAIKAIGGFADRTDLKSFTIPPTVETICSEAFKGCSKLEEISIPAPVELICYCAFEGCSKMKDILVPNGVKKIDNGAFRNCTSLSEFTLPDEIEVIERNAFRGCESLKTIEYHGKGDKIVDIASGITNRVSDSPFLECASLEYVNLPSVDYIGEKLFSDCSNLKSVKTTGCIREIGDQAFLNCKKLEDLEFLHNCQSIGNGAFEGCGFREFPISTSLEYIGSGAFADCENLEMFSINGECNNFSVDASGVLLKKLDGMNWSVLCYPSGRRENSYTLPSNAVEINAKAFGRAKYLEKVEFHRNLSKIGAMAFENCEALTSLDLPESLRYVSTGAFQGCKALKTASIPDNITYIGTSAFDHCESLEEIALPTQLRIMGEAAFNECKSLAAIKIPESLTNIPTHSFRNCKSLSNVELSARLDTIRRDAFYGCEAIENISFPSCLSAIESNAFQKCKSLKEVILPDNVSLLGDNAFAECSSIQRLVVGNKTKELGRWSFFDCASLESILLGESLERIGDQSFDGDYAIREITCLSPTPPVYETGFPDEVCEEATVIVPEGSEEAYNSDPVWDPMVEGGSPVIKAQYIELNVYELELKPGESFTLVATVYPEDAADKTVTWKSDDYYIVQVNDNGRVYAPERFGYYGETLVTAECGDASICCQVTVSESAVDSIDMDSTDNITIYTSTGILIKRDGTSDDFRNLPPGIYIVNGKKVDKR